MAEEDLDPEKCVICLKSLLLSETVSVGSKGLSLDLESYISMCMEQNVKMLVHKDYRRNFTDTKRKVRFDEASSSNTPNKKLRSSMEPFSWKDHCFYVGRQLIKMKGILIEVIFIK